MELSPVSSGENPKKIKDLEANVGFRSELPSAVIDVVNNSDMMFPASKFLDIEHNKQLRSIQILFDNKDINPKVCAYYHHKNRNNPTMLWLKTILQSLLIDNQ